MDVIDSTAGSDVFPLLPLLVLARWVHFASVFVLFGSPLFWFLMDERPGELPRAFRATSVLLRLAAVVAACSGVAWLAGILANMANGFASVLDPETLRVFFNQTQFGPVVELRLALLAAALVITALPWRGRASLAAFLCVGALLLIDQAWLGHAAEGAGLHGALMLTVYSIHVLAAAAWVGGLPPLLFALAEQRRSPPPEARAATLDILSRYSLMAMVAVSLIVASGIANAGFRVGFSFDRLLDADYGAVLAAKAGAVGAMLALAFFNRFIAMPRLRAAGGVAPTARLRASVAVELALGVLVLGIAAVLGVTPPPQ
jgi:putative copper resistance protein D